ncbi:MAG: cobaltochelatase subunit CobN [Rhodospirillaceae bacterium]|nr:cobaltochelatase subunit CobN [Rhodospirillaceae bacterium]
MHLLAAQPGGIADGGEAVDLGQSPGDIVFASAADTELACFARAQASLGEGAPSLRLANLMNLSHNLSVDNWLEATVSGARLVIIRVLGGESYWPYGVERLTQMCSDKGISLALLPGDDKPDSELAWRATLPPEACERFWRYCIHGGLENASECLRYGAHLIGAPAVQAWREPAPLARAGLYRPGAEQVDLDEITAARTREDRPLALLLFYRALVQAADTAPVDDLIAALESHGLAAVALFVSSLKDPPSARFVETVLDTAAPDIILNATGFSVSRPGSAQPSPLDRSGAPILQVIFAGGTEAAWAAGTRGLSARDIAMNVALPEVDGRILSRAVSFKSEHRFDAATESGIVAHTPRADRIDFVARLAKSWARLARVDIAERRVCLVLANYPNKDGRIGNGVGLDTPESAARLLLAMQEEGYEVDSPPADSAALMAALQAGPTNAHGLREKGGAGACFGLDEYLAYFEGLDPEARALVSGRWGAPEGDPFFRADENEFALPVLRLGNAALAIQPARGYNIDPAASYHDPDLPPPHGYLAFYAWLQRGFDAHAVIHFGKHGNLEWLPGKALALSAACFPEAALGPLPHIYPFIVNDPGEGSQAKRRSAAVIIDHLTPPLTRAESYGALRELEALVDEYYEASNLDPRRCLPLAESILEIARSEGIDMDCGIALKDDRAEALTKLDAYMCELKEMQIRNGLHIFGETPSGVLRSDLLLALARSPRGGSESEASLTRALASDLGMAFDPLDCDMATPWQGARPDCLAGAATWRSHGDSVERLEELAGALVAGERAPAPEWRATIAVLQEVSERIAPALDACGSGEMAGIQRALSGRFVAPGPSGAPSRGRPEVLPTGRNFYSLDSRAVPTQSAWQLGWKSAQRLVEYHAQRHGDWPRRMALSAWGTSNMRTGGDDIAQALALLGVRPRWESASGRVIGFEILPLSLLDRPRVDVTLRISGFFRDAFPALIDLFDSAVRAVAALDEPEVDNPLAAEVARETAALVADGSSPDDAALRSGWRVFGSKPGAYGAGLQALIDEGGWGAQADLADAYLAWGGWAYGAGTEGVAGRASFERRLGAVEAVVQNQDNREHDLLDSDDYYQFEGGLAAAVTTLSGRAPASYHNDHSLPENPKIRTLEDEIGRVVRARVVNPKWLAGIMRHGYKGAFEMAATVDYLFAFAATTGAVKDHHFDAVFDAYIADKKMRNFMAEANPAALAEMAARLREALERDLWKPRSNRAHGLLESLATTSYGEAAQ